MEQDELAQARRQNQLDASVQVVSEGLGFFRAETRHAYRMLLWTSAFTREDLERMIRGQVYYPSDGQHPCNNLPDEMTQEMIDVPYDVLSRRPRQGRFRTTLDPVPVARNRLECPLIERALKGDNTVPCHRAQRHLPKGVQTSDNLSGKVTPYALADRQTALLWMIDKKNENVPCRILWDLTHQHLPNELGQPSDLFQPRHMKPRSTEEVEKQVAERIPEDLRDDLQIRRFLNLQEGLVEQQRSLEANQLAFERNLLRFLVMSKRTTIPQIREMAYRGVLVTDPGWLPCRDDKQRNYWCITSSSDEPYSDANPMREYCPYHLRGLLGDKTTPCFEAQGIKKNRTLRARRKELIDEEDYDPIEDDEVPRTWVDEADAPSGPRDIIKRLRVRPCVLLGRMAATYLWDYALHLATHPEEDAEFYEMDKAD